MSDPITTGGHYPQDKTPGEPLGPYEPIETSVRAASRWLVILGIFILAAMTACFLILWELTDVREAADPAVASPRTRLNRPAPRLEYDSPAERLKLNRREDERLSSTGWVDREGGIARIPIDQAIDILARQNEGRTDAESSGRRDAGGTE